MKLPTFRRDAAAGLATAQAKLKEAESRLVELASERALALAESDEVSAVHSIDLRLVGERQTAATLVDRIAVLRAAVRQQQAETTERQRQAALLEVQRRLDQQVQLAKGVEEAVRLLGGRWNELLRWRQAIIAGWPDNLPRPLASDFENVGPLRRELGHALHAAGKPAWDRLCSIPPPVPAMAVEGLSPKGISGYVAAAGAGFLARIKAQRIATPDDDTDEAAA
jgi:hypothetical protein